MPYITNKERERTIKEINKGDWWKKLIFYITLLLLITTVLGFIISIVCTKIYGEGWWSINVSINIAERKITVNTFGWAFFWNWYCWCCIRYS